MTITVVVHISIPVTMDFDTQPTGTELRLAAIENVVQHPALASAKDLSAYVDKVVGVN